MPKQTTASQRARKDARAGAKYTEALRARKAGLTIPAADGPHVVRFLAEHAGSLHHLVGGIAAACAHSGQRVLLLQEASDAWMWAMRPRRRGRPQPADATPPEPETKVLWAAPSDAPGRLVHHTCTWAELEPQPDNQRRGLPRYNRGQLHAALEAARADYDVIVLIPDRSWSYPDRELATAHIVLADVDDFPHTDCCNVMSGGREETGTPLSPEQSAAVLRDRCLRFLFFHHPAPPLTGVIWKTHGKPPVDAAYLAGIDDDMDRVGVPTLGWAPHNKGEEYKELPDLYQLQDTDFVRPYAPIATRMHEVLSARLAGSGQATTSRQACST
ncbi:hypothetical protein ACFQ64_19430 [Streptomyces sp. NPDC056460]|uniref:hypothetical protein n=1 Tax=Streptomyces sp. NPDC056460 TaxID=3345825 RepID=UPI0036A0CC66